MKKRIYTPYLLLAFILLLSLPKTVEARSDELTKTVEKNFQVDANASLKIDNQFGKIELLNNDKNEVEIFVKITVESTNSDKAQKKLDQIEINISGSSSLVEVETEFLNSRHNFKGSFQIDYTIKAPPSMHLDLENNFGDVYIGEWNGPTDIHVEFGSLTVGKLTNEINDINLQFSKGSIGLINKGEVELAYADRFNLDRCKDLRLRSSFSSVNIETAEQLDHRSEYDDVEIEEVNRIEIDASFSSVEIGKLLIRGEISNEYGSIKVKKVSKNFKGLDVENSFSNIRIYFEEGSMFTFECEAEFGDISLPNKADIRIDKKDHTDHYLKGSVGTGENLPHVNIEVEYGSANLDID
jgi:hypothetical protein